MATKRSMDDGDDPSGKRSTFSAPPVATEDMDCIGYANIPRECCNTRAYVFHEDGAVSALRDEATDDMDALMKRMLPIVQETSNAPSVPVLLEMIPFANAHGHHWMIFVNEDGVAQHKKNTGFAQFMVDKSNHSEFYGPVIVTRVLSDSEGDAEPSRALRLPDMSVFKSDKAAHDQSLRRFFKRLRIDWRKFKNLTMIASEAQP